MNEMLLAAVQESVTNGGWSPTTINLIISGIVIIIGALTAGIVAVIRAVNETKKVALETKALVDGRYGQVLNELAEVRKSLAHSTGSSADAASADTAVKVAKDQQAVVDKVNGKHET